MSQKPDRNIPLGIGHELCALCDHVAYFWESDQEFERGVKFLSEGLRSVDDAVVFGYGEANLRVVSVLKRDGFDTQSLIKDRRLTLIDGQEDEGEMLNTIGAAFKSRIDKGVQRIRLLGNLGWGKAGWPDEDHVLRFEAKVTAAAKLFPCIIVCMYDVKAISGRVMLRGALETHPLTIRGNVMRENPHYVEMQAFLDSLPPPIVDPAA